MESVFNTLSQISKVSSTLQKYDILRTNGSKELQELLVSAYNPFKQYYIKQIPSVPSREGTVSHENYHRFLQLLDSLSTREVTGNAAIDKLVHFLEGCNLEEQNWYGRVLQKDLGIGIAEKGINKVFKNLIPVYNVMLAEKVTDLSLSSKKAVSMLPDRIVVQYKIDGYRLNIHRPDKTTVIIKTRNGKEVHGYTELEEASLNLPEGYVYDGELVAPELFSWIQGNIASILQNGTQSVSHHITSNGVPIFPIGKGVQANRDLFSEVMSHAFSKEVDKKGIFNVFDVVPYKDWTDINSTIPYSERLEFLNSLELPENILAVPTSRVYYKARHQDLEEITQLFHSFIQIGWEGAMLKDYDSFYQWKRTKSLIKMKLMDTMDLVVKDIYEGTGKYEGMLGGVYCEYQGNILSVGSGFTDSQRSEWHENPQAIKGKTIEVAYQAITHNKQGGTSVSFPVFKGIRNDK